MVEALGEVKSDCRSALFTELYAGPVFRLERTSLEGVSSGRLTETEAQRLEKQQGRVESAEAKAKADGTLTAAERRRVTNMQNRSSANVYQQKHDPQRAASAPAKR